MYHGFALNVAMNLEPFKWIDPCGYRGLAVTDMKSLGFPGDLEEVQTALLDSLAKEWNLEIKPVGNGEVNNVGR